ncbi:pPIWI_RE module domain-containing protein [Nostoc sp. ChiQUE01b]|uniref:pPIWI_RE module domain-containing protein n=1 Tax=Nostoc sp. ChiQUE01b TaxID=3075376 RepID=UPI002AD53CC9|nr:DUF3962 domain-containing protein [Nostoc sp. ChiQUE01b]MDZ8257905.1 DUF3962 domain-containing protein [Nostoc sp. ChiQUE01b]
MTKIILPGAWELTATNPTCELSAIYVPTAWRQVANNLAQQRARFRGQGYRAVPVYSLDPLIVGSFPQIIKTVRNGWQRGNVPWLLATETTDLSDLGNYIKDWLIEEFSSLEDVESQLANLNNDDWHWEEPKIYDLLHPQDKVETSNLYQAIPDYLAKEFLQNPTVSFGVDEQYQLIFYRVVSLQGAELMSWPPCQVTVTTGKETTETAYISFVIEFVLQTVPWREKPIVYHHLSIRRWLTKPLKYVPYPGVKAHIGDNRRWLDGQRQPFCFIPLMMNRYGKEVKWPQAISNLFSLNDSQLPDANNFVSNPNHNWSSVNTIPNGIQAAIAYTSKLGDPPCYAGVSPQDLASLDQAIEARLPVQRVGEAERVTGNVFIFWPSEKPKKKIVPLLADEENQSNKPKKAKKSDDPNHSHTPMLRPKLVAPAVFRETENPLRTILVLWETPQCRDALIAEICQLLYLSPTKIENIYQGFYGSLCIKTQHVSDLTQDLEIKNFSELRKTYQQQRPNLLAERINKITAFLPQTKELSGALIEIRPKPFISEADPKLAWRIGAMKAGYLNQHIHRITTKADPEKLKKSGLEPVKRAVSDLLRQFGILPDTPLINPKKDGITPDVWLTCFYVLRRTRKTNAENIPKTVVLMIRVNPFTAKVELTTPDLFNKQGWVSYPVGLAHLSDEDWDSNSYDESNEELDEEKKRKEQTKEQRLINKFVAECLQDCLNTPITDNKSPRVLFMAEAQNARKTLNWLQNKNLLSNDPLQTLKQHLSQEEINRLWIVRLRVADNGEVPVAIVKDSPGSRTSGVYRWQNVCDDGERSLYLSIRKGLNTEQDILRKWQFRLDNGNRQAGKARILEIVLIHHPEIAEDKLAYFVHSLRSRWPYFANDVVLPLPFPFAIKAKEYAVSTKDPLESSETDESNF